MKLYNFLELDKGYRVSQLISVLTILAIVATSASMS